MAGIEEEDRRKESEKSLKERFEKKEGTVVYVQSTPERIFTMAAYVLSMFLMIIGIISLVLPETRSEMMGIFVRLIGELTGNSL